MAASLIPQSNHGIMVDDDEELGASSSMSSSFGDEDSANSGSSSFSSDLTEDASSPSSTEGPLYEMSSLFAQLPIKRGLSKHFQGKSQSFTSLTNVRSVEDLAKPERPCKRRLKACKSYGGGLDTHTHTHTQKSLSPSGCSRAITKKATRGSFASLSAKRQSFLGSRPPVPPQRSASQTLLFA